MSDNVLICYDGSPSARTAVAQASSLMCHRKVTLLHVWNPVAVAVTDSSDFSHDHLSLSDEQLNELTRRRAKEIAEEGRELGIDHGLEVNTLVAGNEGSEWETILRIADERDASLIVLGARERGVPGPTLNSVSTEVLEHSTRPVLVIPANGDGLRDAASAA
ncbi:MAG: universal stress protein [Solirubrobacteraceae bacterium]